MNPPPFAYFRATIILVAAWLGLPLFSSGALVFLINQADEGTVSAAEHNAWVAALPLQTPANFGSVADPGTTTGTDLLSQTASATVNASAYSFIVTEGGSTGTGTFASTIVSGANPGSGLSGFGTVNFDFERPVTQSGAGSSTWGYDTSSSLPNVVASTRDTLRYDFTASATAVHVFSGSLIDFESSAAGRGYIAAYDTGGILLGSLALDFGLLDGAGEAHQFAVGLTDSSASLGYLFFVVGDNTSSLAMGDFSIGTTLLAPEPSRAMLVIAGLLPLALARRRGAQPC